MTNVIFSFDTEDYVNPHAADGILRVSRIVREAGFTPCHNLVARTAEALEKWGRQDVLDELCDRFGDPPRVAERLLRIAYMRSRGAAYRLRRIECSGGYLRFLPDKADLAVWSELFLRFPGLSLRGVGTPAVLYRLKTDEDATDTAFAILKAYTEVSNKEAPSA